MEVKGKRQIWKEEEITGEPHEKKGDKMRKDQGGRPCKQEAQRQGKKEGGKGKQRLTSEKLKVLTRQVREERRKKR